MLFVSYPSKKSLKASTGCFLAWDMEDEDSIKEFKSNGRIRVYGEDFRTWKTWKAVVTMDEGKIIKVV